MPACPLAMDAANAKRAAAALKYFFPKTNIKILLRLKNNLRLTQGASVSPLEPRTVSNHQSFGKRTSQPALLYVN